MNYKAIVERIIDTAQEKLNPWELDFISDIYEKCILREQPLTKGRKTKILEINRRLLR